MPVYEYRGKYYESAETDPGKAKTKILQFLQSTPEGKQRTYGEAFQDVGAGVVGGIGSLVQVPGQLYGLVTGDMRPTGSLGLGQEIREYAESLKSPGLKAREQARAEAIEKATQEGGQLGAFTTTLSQTVKDPGLLLNFLAEQAPQLLIPFGAAKIGKGIASLAGAGQATAATAGVGSAVVAGAVQQGADVGEGAYRNIYEELKRKGATDEEAAEGAINLARSAGASGAVISGLAQLLPGARGIERAFARAPAAQTVIPRVATSAAGEAGAEIAEEVGGKLAQNVAMQQVKPEQSLTEGLGQTAGLAAIGGGVLGGAAGLVPRPQPEPPPPAPPPPLPPPAPPQPPTPEQQRIDTVTGVSREPAVRQEGLLTGPQAEAQQRNALLTEVFKREYMKRGMSEQEASAEATNEAIARFEQLRQQYIKQGLSEDQASQSAIDESLRRRQIATSREGADESARQQEERTRREGVTGETKFPVTVPPTPRFEPQPQVLSPEQLKTKQAAADQRRMEAGLPTAQQRREGITDVPKKIEPKSPVPKLVDPRPLTEEQAKNRLIVLKDMLRIKGGDPNSLTIVQHPSAATKYAIKSFDLPFKFDPDAYVRTFGKERTGRGEGPPTIIDPVEAYVNVARRTDTPAAKRFVRDWDAGRITRQDVEAALEAEKKGPIETTAKRPAGDQGPLTFTAAPEVKIAQQPIPGPTIETALAYKPRGEREVPFAPPPPPPPPPPLPPPPAPPPLPPPPPTAPQSKQEVLKKLPVDNTSAELAALVNSGDMKNVLEYFKKHKNPFYVRVAELMEPLAKTVKLAKPKAMPYAGVYNFKYDTITMSSKNPGREKTLIHEMVHALVARSQIFSEAKHKKFVNGIKDLRDYAEKAMRKSGKLIDPATGKKWYAFNISNDAQQLGLEFVTEAMSYPEFQYELMQIPYAKTQSVWSRFVQLVADLLGFQNKTALSEAMSLIEQLAQLPRAKVPVTYSKDSVLQSYEAARKQYTSTPAFKKWFGRSKVVDENGEPMVVYRGVRKVPSANVFRMTQGRSTPSFAADPEVANVYARSLDTREYERGSTMVPAYLSIKNPLDIRQLGEEVSLEGIVNMLPTDFEKASGMRTERNKRRVGYSDLAEAIRDMDSLTYETGARFNIDVLDNEGFRIKSFSDLADYIDDLGNEGDYASIDLALMDVTFDGYLIGDSPDWNYLLSSLGFDGVIHKDVFDVGSRYYKGDPSKLEEGYEGPVHDTFRPFEQTQIKSAIGNRGTFDPKNPDILASEQAPIVERAQQILQKRPPLKLAPEITEEERRRLQETFAPDNKTIIDKVKGLEDRFWQRMAQKFADQFRTIKDYSEKGYMQARLSKAIDGAVEGLLFYGQVFNDGGALNIRPQTKGLIDILKPVGPEVDNFMIWIALNRETNLREQEKEPSIPDDVLALKNKLSAGMIGNQTRLQVYNDVLKELNALNKSVLTVAFDSGLIDKDAFKRFSEDIYYVPFYKAIENEDIEAPMLASGLTGQYFSKQLKGGEKKFGDLVENTLLNWNHILSAAMKNQAAVQTIRDASTFMMGDEAVVEPTTEKTGAAKVMIDGQARYFRINDPLLFESIGSIGYIGGQSYAIDIMRPFKNLLQMGVTISPQFRVNNLIRDSISSLAVTPINKNFAMNVLTGVSVYREKGGTFISALSGGAIFNFGTAYEGNQSVMIKRLIERGVNPDTILDDENKIKKGLKFLWDKYQDWGNASEAANRLALYKQLRDRGLSHLEATFQARDLLDFSMQGSWPTFRFLTQVVPFLNARVQGLYKLGRDGISPTVRVFYNSATGREIQATDAQKARAFSTVSMAVVLASMALYGAFKDDEEFKKRDDWDRDNFWWFRLPNMDVAFRIPKPFEIGAFGTLAERILEQMFDEEAEGKVFGDTLVRMLTDTFAINPTPQLFKPLLDIYANENAFTGAPIETEGQERLSKQERYNDRTSALAKALGGITGAFLPQEIELSPVQIDHLIQGYLGWLGATIATTSNYAVMPFNEGEYPDANWINRASLGLARDLPSPYSKYVTAFYKNGKAINQAYADMRHYAAIGQSEEVQRILEERGDKVSLAKLYDKTAKEMAKVRQHIRVIVADPQMTGAEKREEIDRLNMLIGEMAQNAEEIRRSVYAEQ